MIEVHNPGIYCSVQDLGRFGSRRYGVPLSGVMDRPSAVNANALLGNEESAAVLEFANPGPKLFFNKPAIIAIAGATFQVHINGESIATSQPVLVETNSIVDLGRAQEGVWGYLAVKGGILSESVLGSMSFYSGITRFSRITKGHILEIAALSESSSQEVNWGKKLPDYNVNHKIEAWPGPEYELLSEYNKLALFDNDLKVTPQSNRMASLLVSELAILAPEIITSPVQPGTIQITPSGKIIALMRDAQTTGGYARILQLSDEGITNLTRIQPGESVQFKLN
ncbi:MAG: biotin-dependent carboxyltransferase family protein [Bacteroidia bacterium]|nr:biotin-dependent carboxyltransferase family protein [Bacteroidia bacterium]NNF31241.1 biotin-dependent carboxyltransferase family protein [Flavobacteriaceae bacterium]NNK54564.1 biotin-dependent carboxyltransferase family protein [Flavobacteriaceae bacterium]NNM09367.1 biotin-dependent carboxyltransferase family protein [Flavobacteriaceae bacterium]